MKRKPRDSWRSELDPPTPEQFAALIGDRTQQEFADKHGLERIRVNQYANQVGLRPHWALWELLLLREGQHPTHKIIRKSAR